MANPKVEAIKHTDVFNKEKFYIKISNTKGDTHHINVGQKTFDAVDKLLKSDDKK